MAVNGKTRLVIISVTVVTFILGGIGGTFKYLGDNVIANDKDCRERQGDMEQRLDAKLDDVYYKQVQLSNENRVEHQDIKVVLGEIQTTLKMMAR